MLLSRFPRVRLAHLPTPLEHLPRLSEYLGGPQIYVKRDDCTGLATGGNKTRKLEFSMAAALEEGADTIVTVGAVQSNHVRQTADAACKLGLACEVLLEHRVSNPTEFYTDSGNVLLDRIFGANLREYPGGTDFDAAMAEVADEVRAAGGKPYIIPGGASNPVGALGYVNCAIEMLDQFDEQGLDVGHIVTATGSAGTQGGLVVGLKAMASDIPLLGIGVNVPRDKQEQKVYDLACETAEFIGKPGCVAREDVPALWCKPDADGLLGSLHRAADRQHRRHRVGWPVQRPRLRPAPGRALLLLSRMARTGHLPGGHVQRRGLRRAAGRPPVDLHPCLHRGDPIHAR